MSVPNYTELTKRVWGLWDLFDFGSLRRSDCDNFKHNKFEGWVGFTLKEDFIKVKYNSVDDTDCEIIVNDDVVLESVSFDNIQEELENRFDIMVTSFL